MTQDKDLIPVVYIAGAGRSGSSILGEALGMLPGALHLGEIMGIFDYATDPSGLSICSCGEPYHRCAFWDPLLREVFGSQWRSLFNSFGLFGKVPRTKTLLWQKFIKGSVENNINLVAKNILVMKTALAQTNSQVIIDSSKSVPYALLLASSGSIKMFLIHLVRDPRGVLFSWTRRPIPIYSETDQTSILRRRTFFDALWYWIIADMGAHLLQFLGFYYTRVRYEDFVADPEKTIRLVIETAQKRGMPLYESTNARQLLKDRKVIMHGHWSGSNPRLKTQPGTLIIEPDNKWIDGLAVWEKLLLNVVLSPWLIFYGYYGR